MRTSDTAIDRIYINSLTRNANFKTLPNHFHNYYELYYVKQGNCTLHIDSLILNMKAGNMIIIPPNLNHFVIYNTQCTRVNIYFNHMDIYDNGKPFISTFEERFLQTQAVHIPSTYVSTVNKTITEMLAEDKLDDTSTKTMMQLKFRELLIYINRFGLILSDQSNDISDPAILSIVKYISANYNQPLTLEYISEMAGLSPSYFSKKFHQVTGAGLKEFIIDTRLRHAATELLSTDHNITEVAFNTGFSDSNYFKDAFKKKYKLSPREYRKAKYTDAVLYQSIKDETN
ncbi:MAG: AraC family transcriptional regulator [Eubacterium sp.]|nr:AraC family transcriptional regulator [Eubacterium sp.]